MFSCNFPHQIDIPMFSIFSHANTEHVDITSSISQGDVAAGSADAWLWSDTASAPRIEQGCKNLNRRDKESHHWVKTVHWIVQSRHHKQESLKCFLLLSRPLWWCVAEKTGFMHYILCHKSLRVMMHHEKKIIMYHVLLYTCLSFAASQVRLR